jgi:hypothetical protein
VVCTTRLMLPLWSGCDAIANGVVQVSRRQSFFSAYLFAAEGGRELGEHSQGVVGGLRAVDEGE